MTQESPRRERRTSGALPIILILVGVLLLITNIGWLSWGTLFDVLNLWPVVLLAIGVDMLTRGRYRTAVLVGALVVGGVLYGYQRSGGRYLGGGGAAETHAIEHTLGGANGADISIGTGVSTLHIGSFSGGDVLVRGSVETRRGETLTDDFFRRGDQAVLQLRSEQSSGVGSLGVFGNQDRRWDLDLNEGVPIKLGIDAGVGRGQLDLRNLQLTDLRISAGVGEMTVTLPAQGAYSATLKAGVGATTVHIPAGVPTRLTVNTGLGAVSVQGDFERNGDVYTTPDYEGAARRADVSIQGGLGAIHVDRVR